VLQSNSAVAHHAERPPKHARQSGAADAGGGVVAPARRGPSTVAGRRRSGTAGDCCAAGVRQTRVVEVDGRNRAVHRHQRRRWTTADTERARRCSAATGKQVIGAKLAVVIEPE